MRLLTAVFGLSLGLGMATATHAQEKVVKIGFSSVYDLKNDNGMSAWIIENYVDGRSDTLEVEVHGSSELGSDQDVIQAMQLGSGATMSIGGTALYNTFIPRVGVLDLPFLWQSYDHVAAALDGPIGEALAGDFEKAGFKVLGWGYSWGYRNVVTADKQVSTPEDISGLKIRTIQSPIYVAALNAMGANATPMAFGEVYTALQTGVLDGFEHAASMVLSSKLYEVTKHVALTRHLFGVTAITYSLPLWQQLTPEEQKTMQEAADLAIEINRALAPGREQEALAELVEVGMTVQDIDTTPFREAAIPLQDKLASDIGAGDLLEGIRAAAPKQ
jgi:tripartite ATP-independent transporter DctP family solute receptor